VLIADNSRIIDRYMIECFLKDQVDWNISCGQINPII